MISVSNVNWTLLREQKHELLAIRAGRAISKSECEALDGIINLIDYIQDEAIEEFGETTIFGEEIL